MISSYSRPATTLSPAKRDGALRLRAGLPSSCAPLGTCAVGQDRGARKRRAQQRYAGDNIIAGRRL